MLVEGHLSLRSHVQGGWNYWPGNYWPPVGTIGQTLELLASHWNNWPEFQGTFLANSSNPL